MRDEVRNAKACRKLNLIWGVKERKKKSFFRYGGDKRKT